MVGTYHQLQAAALGGSLMIAEKHELLLYLLSTINNTILDDAPSSFAWQSADAVGKSSHMQPGKQRQSRRQDDDGLSDVWFESKPKRKNSKKSPEDPFW